MATNIVYRIERYFQRELLFEYFVNQVHFENKFCEFFLHHNLTPMKSF